MERNEEMRALRREGLTLQEIGDRFGVTRERVRQLTRGVMVGRRASRDIVRALPLYAPIEITINNPWGVRELCQRCLRPSTQETPWGPACDACQSSIRYRNDPEHRARRSLILRRYNSGACPRPGPRCQAHYADIWQHLQGHSGHAKDYEELWALLRKERGLFPRPAPPRRCW